jgi:periplasmic protein TonB
MKPAAIALNMPQQPSKAQWQTMRRDPLLIGLAVSVLIHVLLLMLRFAPPLADKFAPLDSPLEVVLLNAQTKDRPEKAEVLAQVNQQGGGDKDSGRAKSPLPPSVRQEDGDQLRRQQQRVAELEEQQRKLLALTQGPQAMVQQDRKPTPANAPPLVGLEEEDVSAVIARLQAQIDKQISDYNKRPRRLTYGVNAKGVAYAQYVDAWADTIERIGTERYPPEARGRIYDTLIITVEIDKHGNVVDVVINKKSRHEVLNRVVKQIVYAGAPYARFTPEMAKEGDILQIVRAWTFTNDSLATEAVVRPAAGPLNAAPAPGGPAGTKSK